MAVRTISTKLAVEGEAEYKQKIASCNSELKTLKSSLALVQSEYKNNANSMEALTAKGEALSAEQNYQTQLAYYKAGNSKVRYKHNATGTAAYVWCRSAYYSYSAYFCLVLTSGDAGNCDAYYSLGVAPLLNV